MSFLGKLFGGGRPSVLEHPLFGRLELFADCSWERAGLSFWGYPDVKLSVMDLDRVGPSKAQETAFTALRDAGERLRPECLTVLEAKRREAGAAAGEFALVSVVIPNLDAPPILGFQAAGDERHLYRLDVENGGRSLKTSIEDLAA